LCRKLCWRKKLYGIDEEPDSNTIPVHVHHCGGSWSAASADVAIHTVRASATSSPRSRK